MSSMASGFECTAPPALSSSRRRRLGSIPGSLLGVCAVFAVASAHEALLRQPQRPTLQDGLPENATAVVGSDVELRCVVLQGDGGDGHHLHLLHVQWLKHVEVNGSLEAPNGSPYVRIVSTVRAEVGDVRAEVLYLRNVSTDDSGRYTCLAVNAAGFARRSAWLLVVPGETPPTPGSRPLAATATAGAGKMSTASPVEAVSAAPFTAVAVVSCAAGFLLLTTITAVAAFCLTQTRRARRESPGGEVEMQDAFEEPHEPPPPSAVVHVRGLADSALQSDLVEAVQRFGPVSYVAMMPNLRQALVEFEDLEGSRSCVDSSSTGSVYVCGRPAYFNFSTSQKIWRPGIAEDNSNHILLFTILNPIYPITTGVLYNICNPCGPLQRLVIFRKNGLQAMVEFDSVESAQRAKSSLNGADIYSRCCTLLVEYARPTRLNVFKNDSETWDFTNPGLKLEDNAMVPVQQTSLLGYHPKAHACGGGGCFGGHQQPPPPGVGYGSGGDGTGGGGGMGMGNQGGPQGSPQGQHVQAMMNQQAGNKVLMVYGFDAERINCDRVFNILCLFGDVVKVKFLKSKPGAAMVEMGDPYAVHRAVFHLNMSWIFGNQINLCASRQRSIVPGQAYELPDGTNSYKDYTGSRNHRFTDAEKAAKNRHQQPSTVLHFFNAPMDITAEIFMQLCDNMSIARPRSFQAFTGKIDRSMSGLLEWETKNGAMEALACINHHPLKSANGLRLNTLKLCFSTAQPS